MYSEYMRSGDPHLWSRKIKFVNKCVAVKLVLYYERGTSHLGALLLGVKCCWRCHNLTPRESDED